MTVHFLRAVALAVACGLNPWLTLLIVLGLATFTAKVPLTPTFDPLRGVPAVVLLGALLGVDVVTGKLRRLVWASEVVNLVAAAGAAIAVFAALPGVANGWAATIAAALVAVAVRLARWRSARALDRPLLGFGHVAMGIAADLSAAIVTTVAFTVLR